MSKFLKISLPVFSLVLLVVLIVILKCKPEKPEAPKPPKIFYALGDGMTLGAGSGGYNYMDKLHNLTGWDVENLGEGGDTTGMMLKRMTDQRGYWVVWGGIDDIYKEVPVETTIADLQLIYDKIHSNGSLVIAVNVTPSGGDKNWSVEKSDKTKKINGWIAKSNADYKVDIYSAVEDPLNPNNILPLFNGDGLHLKQDGYYIVADEIYRLIF